MGIGEKLTEYGKKNISLDDLASIMRISVFETESLYRGIAKLIDAHIIAPVKASDTNGNKNYPLYKKYRIVLDNTGEEGELLEKIKNLHPTLLRNGYLSSHLKEFKDNSEVIDRLSVYFFSNSSDEFISRKERSFVIFGREKILDEKDVKSLLRNLEISDEDLRFYDTPEYCFHDYIPVRKEHMTLLICENKDIWFNIRRLMFEDKVTSIFGVEIDGVVYGNGNKVSQKQGALTEYVRFMGSPEVKFFYWGDIDREGFEIFRRAKEVNDSLNLALFLPGYKKMIERGKDLQIEDSPSSRLENKSFIDLIKEFSVDEQRFLLDIFDSNKLVPQEIISYIHLSKG